MSCIWNLGLLAAAMVTATVVSAAQPSAPNTPADGRPSSAAARPLRVVVSIPPLEGLVRPLLESSGLSATVNVLIPPGVSEHGYEIPPSRMAGLARADLVVLVGLGMEPQVERVLADRRRPERRVVVAGDAAGIANAPSGQNHAHDHSGHAHGPNGECLHAVDPHVWLDPVLTEKIVSKTAEELRAWVGADADTAKRIWLAEEGLLTRVREVHQRYSSTLAPATRRTLVVGHDAWGYLARRYDLNTVSIKDLTANEPTPQSMAAAVRAIREQGVTTVFVEPQLSRAAGDRIARTAGVDVAELDPLGSGDWFGMMNMNLERIAKSLGVPVVSGGASGVNPEAPGR